jgi:hypothetical protein
VVSLVNDRWLIKETAASLAVPWPVELPMVGMELLSCEGIKTADWAHSSIGNYLVNWQVKAQRIQHASKLFIGEMGINPFVSKPAQCRFEYQGLEVTLALNWQLQETQLLRSIALQRSRQADVGVSKFYQGYWVSLSNQGGDADKLLEQVEDLKQQLQKAPFVVLDLRGGSLAGKQIQDRIAMALYGETQAKPPLSGFSGQLLLLTDDHCFGACLLTAEFFLDLGAVQMGKATHTMAHSHDTQNHLLPSGLSCFTTMTKVGLAVAKWVGPFVPQYTYYGNMNDTLALQSWILSLMESDRD